MKFHSVASAAAAAVCLARICGADPPSTPELSDFGVSQYRVRAAAGNVRAQIALAGLYLTGTAVARSQPEAASWFRKAALQGSLEAQIALADLCREYSDVHNYAEAARWYAEASISSQYAAWRLGDLYAAGDGVPPDPARAAELYRRAALAGVAGAETHLGNLYLCGDGVGLDYEEARRWYLRAAAQGDGEALLNLAGMFYQGLGVPRDLRQAAAWAQAAKRVQARDADAFLGVIEAGE